MGKHDIIRHVGKSPDKPINKDKFNKRLRSKGWKCSRCEAEYLFDDPVTIPTPCKYCGSIFFTKLEK